MRAISEVETSRLGRLLLLATFRLVFTSRPRVALHRLFVWFDFDVYVLDRRLQLQSHVFSLSALESCSSKVTPKPVGYEGLAEARPGNGAVTSQIKSE